MSKTIKLKQNPKPEKVKATYDEKSPITGNLTVLVENVEVPREEGQENGPAEIADTYKICMETGYQTYWNTWREDYPDLVANIEKQMPEYIVKHKYVDSYKRIWYPMTTISYVASLYPTVDANNQLGWCVAKIYIAENEEELKGSKVVKLPVLSEGETKMAYFIVDEANAKYWKMNEFESAFDEYQLIVTEESQKLSETINALVNE
jgi:hypothetical protein